MLIRVTVAEECDARNDDNFTPACIIKTILNVKEVIRTITSFTLCINLR